MERPTITQQIVAKSQASKPGQVPESEWTCMAGTYGTSPCQKSSRRVIIRQTSKGSKWQWLAGRTIEFGSALILAVLEVGGPFL